jgi:hypothetical protein
LHWIIKAIVLVVLAIRFVLRPKAVRYGLALLIVAGVVAWQFFGQQLTDRGMAQAGTQAAAYQATNTGAIVSVPNTQQLSPEPVVEKYIKAQADFNAAGMWEAISDDLKQQLASSNTSLDDLQQELNSAKQSGRRYGRATFVAGAPLDTDAKAYFYVLDVETPNGTMHVPYVYVVGGDGKIASIQ